MLKHQLEGIYHLPNYLSANEQSKLLELCREIRKESPLFTPTMASGKPFNYQMTNCGLTGWVSDRHGYRYTKTHPITNQPWAKMPSYIGELARKLVDEYVPEYSKSYFYKPETCLINYYQKGGRLGLHQDVSEKNLIAPIISISLGDSALFGIGGLKRSDPITDLMLNSGDILILSSQARLAFHEVKKIIPVENNILWNRGRLNLTIRQVYSD